MGRNSIVEMKSAKSRSRIDLRTQATEMMNFREVKDGKDC